MPRQRLLYRWQRQLASVFPHLSRPQVAVLALYSLAVVLVCGCGLDKVARLVAEWLGGRVEAARQRLREWSWPANHKRGDHRRQIEPQTCFGPLWDWVLDGWPSGRLVLALDATALGERLTVLALSVVYQGSALPVAWRVLPGNTPGAWLPVWRELLASISGRTPADWTVLVLTDRGLESAELYQAIRQAGFHPLMRLQRKGTFRPRGWRRFHPLAALVPVQGARFCYRGALYQQPTARQEVTLVGLWESGHEGPWLLATDLEAAAACAAVYAFRSWIEQSFRLNKRGGWQLHRTRMRDPERVARLMLVLAVATHYVVRVGGEVEAGTPRETVGVLPQRRLSLFWQGLCRITARLLTGQSLPHGRWLHQPWPKAEPFENTITQHALEPP